MKTLNTEKVIFWQEHILKAKQHPGGIQSYLDLHNLPQSSFYKWQSKLLNLQPVKKQIKKAGSAFLPVVMSEPTPNFMQASRSSQKLPDPRWVAAVLANLIQELT